MKFAVTHQDKYSRGQLILRTLFGWLYIGIPHLFLLFFVGIWSAILSFLAFWAILFTGHYPAGWYEFQVKYLRWNVRVGASLINFVDGYPPFGTNGASSVVTFEADRPERISRGLTILRLLFGGIYVGIPHGFCLFFRGIGSAVLMFLAWWAVLFTGHYPERWHAFNVGTHRWGYRVYLYLLNMTDTYPVFSGKD